MVAEGGQVAFGVGVQAAVIHFLNEGPFLFQAGFGQVQQFSQPGEQGLPVLLEQVAQPGQVDGHYADGAGHFRGAEKAAAAFEQFPQVQLETAAHGTHGIRLVGPFVRHAFPVFIDGVLAADEVLEVRGTDFGGVFKQERHVFPFPVKVFRDVDGGDGEGEGLSGAVPFRENFVKGLVDQVHFLLEMLVGQFRQLVCPAFPRQGEQVRVFYSFKEVFPSAEGGLVPQVARHSPVDRDIGKGRLSPARGYVQVVNETADVFLDAGEVRLVLENVGRQEGVKGAEGLGAGPFALQNAQKVRHLAQGFPEVAGRPAVHAAAHAVESFIEQVAEAPSGAVSGQAIQVMDVVIPFPVRGSFPCGVNLVQPIVGDYLARRVVDEPRIGIRGIGVGGNAPVALPDIFLYRLLAVHIGIAGIKAAKLFALHFVQETVGDEGLGRVKISGAEQGAFNHVLNLFHMRAVLMAQLGFHLFIDGTVVGGPGTVEGFSNGLFNLIALVLFLFPGTFDDACCHGGCLAWKGW